MIDNPINERELDSIREPDRMFHILDADSSQQVCIELARQGQSFVLHGPPGTGKSQTISNIIAEFIEAGKTVLFVSEKMAALEVVFKRLRETGLGDFCLELHSHKANKREVVKELNRSLEELVVPKKSISNIEFQRLLQLREKLNNYVVALHRIREPLGESVFKVLGNLVSLKGVPFVQVDIPNLDGLTPGRTLEFEELVLRMKNVWRVAEEGKNFPWYGCLESRFTLDVQSELASLLDHLINSVDRLKSVSAQYASAVGLNTASTLSEVDWLVKIGNLLTQSPGINPSWLTSVGIDNLIKEANYYHDLCNSFRTTRSSLEERYNGEFFNLPIDITSQVEKAWTHIVGLLNPNDFNGAELLVYRSKLLEFVKETQRCIKEWLHDASHLGQHLGLEVENLSLERLNQIGKLALLCCSDTRPEANWLDPVFLQKVKNILPKTRERYEEYKNKKRKVMELYHETILPLDLDRLIQCYSGSYGTVFDMLLPAFLEQEDKLLKAIPSFDTTEQSPSLEAFLPAQFQKERVWEKGIEFLQVFERFLILSGELFRDANQLVRRVGIPIEHITLERIRNLVEVVVQTMQTRCEADWLDPVRLKQVEDTLLTAKSNYNNFKASKERLMEIYDESFLEMDLDRLIEKYNGIYKTLFRWLSPSFYKDRKAIARVTRGGVVPTSIREDLLAARELNRLRLRLEKESERTVQILGRLFQGHDTNFELIERTYNTASEIIRLAGFPVPDEFIRVVSLDVLPDRELINLGTKLLRSLEEWNHLLPNFVFLFPSEQVTSSELLVWQSPFVKIQQWLSNLEIPLADLRTIAKVSRKGTVPITVREDLLLAREVNQMRIQLENEREKVSALLGRHYQSEDTNFDLVEQALNVASEALILIGTPRVPIELLTAISLGTTPAPELRTIGSHLLHSLESREQSASELSSLIPLDRLPGSGLPIWQSPLPSVEQWANEIEAPLSVLYGLTEHVFQSCAGFTPTDLATVVRDLQTLDNLRAIESGIAKESDRLRQIYGSWFTGINTEWSAIISALYWTREIRELFGTRSIPTLFVDLASLGARAVPVTLELIQTYQMAVGILQSLQNRFEAQELHYNEIPLCELTLDHLLERIRELRSRIDELQDWIEFKILEKRFAEVGLHRFLQKLVTNPPPAPQLVDVFRRGIYQAWIDMIYTQDPHLGEFRGQNHEQAIAEFCQLDQKLDRLSAYLVIEQANLRKPQDIFMQARDTEIAVLKREAGKRRGHLPIRRLFERIPNLLTRLKPCLLMSPLSVSQFLPSAAIKFDLVVFDEASQICTEDAVGSIYRGNQLVVAGDNRQLPPTAFFQQGIAEEYDWDDIDDEEFAIFESILDECKAIGLPEKMLKWHYRSKHESLIAFSNKRFYDDRLVTFPASRFEHETLGIKFRPVPDGIFDRGGKRNNPREATVVADLVFEQLRRYPNKTLGVVTFNLAQMTTIEDEIELRRRTQPEFERFFKEDRLEGFFVKNLENVQGDERDVIIFSVGFGYDQRGRITMNFGPLNKPGGERRLNVAVTRAREKVILVSSIKASNIDLNATQAAGVLNLYRYLDYAERGAIALELSHPQGIGEYESPLEEDVAIEIRRLGYEVIPQVGCSGYRIDLGVVDPAEPGRFLLGVECDGATYHSAYTARDRDRIRQQVLEAFGWRIHRMWSPDWVNKRDTEIKRLKQAIEDARQHALHHSESAKPGSEKESMQALDLQIETESIKLKPIEQTGSLFGTIPYKVCELQPSSEIGPEFHLPQYRREQNRLLTELVKEEGPIHVQYAARRLVSAWGLGRIGSRVVDAIKEAVRLCQKGGNLRIEGKFLWPPQVTEVPIRVPTQGVPESFRSIEHIPPEEIKGAMLLIIRHAVGISVESLLVETARIFGFNRTGDNIRKELLKIIKTLQQEGTIIQNGDFVTLVVNKT